MDMFGGLPTIEDEPAEDASAQVKEVADKISERIGDNTEDDTEEDAIERRVAPKIKAAEKEAIATFKGKADAVLEKIKTMSASELNDFDAETFLDELLIDEIVKPLYEKLKENEPASAHEYIDNNIDYSDYAPKLGSVYEKYVAKGDTAVGKRQDQLDDLDALIDDASSSAASDLQEAVGGMKEPQSHQEVQGYNAKIKEVRDILQAQYESKISKAGGSPESADWEALDEEFESLTDEYSDDPDDWDEDLGKALKLSFRGVSVSIGNLKQYRFEGVPVAIADLIKAPCGRGWEGTKPGCVRAKSKKNPVEKAESAKQQGEVKPKTKGKKSKKEKLDNSEKSAIAEKEESKSNGNFLKKRVIDGAIPDFSSEDLTSYISAKAKVNKQDDPNAAHNIPYESWLSGRQQDGVINKPGNYRGRYGREIKESIEEGNSLSNEMLEHLTPKNSGLKKADLKQLKIQSAENGEKIEALRESIEPVENILNKSLLTDEESKGYKPLMDEEEASNYTKDSFMGDWSFHHGTNAEFAADIVTNGVKPEANENGMFGAGFYMGASQEIAEYYAGNSNSEYISSKIKVKNPYIVEDINNFVGGNDPLLRQYAEDPDKNDEITAAVGRKYGDTSTATTTMMLRIRGHDSIYLQKEGYFIAFDKKQVATFSKKKARGREDLGDLSDWGLNKEESFNQLNKIKGDRGLGS